MAGVFEEPKIDTHCHVLERGGGPFKGVAVVPRETRRAALMRALNARSGAPAVRW